MIATLNSARGKRELLAMEENLAKKMGPLVLFAFLQPEDALWGLWDVVVSSDYVKDHGDYKSIDLIAKLLKSSKIDPMAIAKIVPLSPDAPLVKAVTSLLNVESSPTDVQNCVFDGLKIERGIVITSRKEHKSATKRKPRPLNKTRTV